MSLAQHLPALQVVIPLLAAPLTVLLRHRTLAFAVALLASWTAFAISIALWLQVGLSLDDYEQQRRVILRAANLPIVTEAADAEPSTKG